MKFLILIHVLSAIIGVGPTFFGHVLLRKNQTLSELRASLRIAHRLELFPKIGGPIAVLTGLALVFLGNYGRFTQLWLLGSLIVYILIQIIVIAVIGPYQKSLLKLVLEEGSQSDASYTVEQRRNFITVSNLYYVSSALGVLLFILMIVRPS